MNERMMKEVQNWRKRQGILPRFKSLTEYEAKEEQRRTQAAQAAWRYAVATGADR